MKGWEEREAVSVSSDLHSSLTTLSPRLFTGLVLLDQGEMKGDNSADCWCGDCLGVDGDLLGSNEACCASLDTEMFVTVLCGGLFFSSSTSIFFKVPASKNIIYDLENKP